MAAHRDLDPADVGWSLATTRSAFAHRAVITGAGREDLAAALAAVAAGMPAPGAVTGEAADPGRVVFVFPGQGAQWAGMGRELAECSPVFAARLAECARALAPHAGWDLHEVLAGGPGVPGLGAAEVAQPVLWAVMVSLAAVWQAAGVTPDAVLGHSQGEIAAAVVAGVLSLEDGARVVAARSRGLSGLGVAGGMVSVVMPEEAVRELTGRWGDRLAVAAVNGPAQVVVSGEQGALGEFEAELAARRVLRWRVEAGDFVAHSPLVDPLAGPLAAELSGIRPGPGRVRLFSTVLGRWMDGPELDAGYWFANVREPVRFADAVTALACAGHRVFIEVSPQPVLISAVSETLEQSASGPVVVTGTADRAAPGAAGVVASLARMHVAGITVDWTAVLGGAGGWSCRRAHLSTEGTGPAPPQWSRRARSRAEMGPRRASGPRCAIRICPGWRRRSASTGRHRSARCCPPWPRGSAVSTTSGSPPPGGTASPGPLSLTLGRPGWPAPG